MVSALSAQGLNGGGIPKAAGNVLFGKKGKRMTGEDHGIYHRERCVVFRKTHEAFGGLSNMAAGFPLRVNGVSIRTSEALYQACRFPDKPDVQKLIIEEKSPMSAKMVGKPYREQSRPDWDRVRVRIMRWCLRVKLARNWPAFRQLLLSTGNRAIVEDSGKDPFWGAQPQTDGTLVGENVLGRLLMELREDLQKPTDESLKWVEPIPIPDFSLFGEPIERVVPWPIPAEILTDPDLDVPETALWRLPEKVSGPAEQQPGLVKGLASLGQSPGEPLPASSTPPMPVTDPPPSSMKSVTSGPRLTETPAADRPRERLLALGAPALRTAELVAILVRSGLRGESALQAGEKVAARFATEFERLADAGRGELKAVSPAIGDAAFCQIMAGIELGRRVAEARKDRQQPGRRILGSADALEYCRYAFSRLAADGAQEEFHIVCLDAKSQVVGKHPISVGSLDRSLVHPREVFRPAIKDAAKAILLVHNHPSGDPTPSADDLILTSRLEDAGKTVGIEVLDHIVVARHGASSIREYRSERRLP